MTYQVAENGSISIAEGLVLLDKLVLINGVDTSYQLTAEQKNINAPSLSWTSSNTSVATVGSSTGLVTVVGVGETTITVSVTYNNKNYSAECNVTIANLTVELGTDRDVVIEASEILTPTITPASVASREDITINWTSSVTSVATVNPATGTSTTVSVPSETSANSTSLITVTIKKGTTTLATDSCTVKAIVSPWIDSSYVNYNVEYTDVYTGTEYKANTGWRLLTDLSSYESAGTFEGNIEIISTGILAKLYYNNNSIIEVEKTSDTTGLIKGKWAGDETDRTNFVNTFYGNAFWNNAYGASGLFYNFGNIIFDVVGETLNASTLTKEKGGYRAISKNGTAVAQSSATIGDDLFKATVASGTVVGVRSVNLKDIKNITTDSTEAITTENDRRPGLFKLNDYTPDVHSSEAYWLASPRDGYTNALRTVGYDGYIRQTPTPRVEFVL